MISLKKGVLITLEGGEGSGKSTLQNGLADVLTQQYGIAVVKTREPGGVPLAEKIRELVVQDPMNPITELYLYQAARYEHFCTVIKPALARGAVVICDRFTDSTLAYQGFGRKVSLPFIKKLNAVSTERVDPHLTFFLKISPKQGLSRADRPNKFEREATEFHQAVYRGFLHIARTNKRRVVTLDVERKSIDEVRADALKKLIPFIEKRLPKSE